MRGKLTTVFVWMNRSTDFQNFLDNILTKCNGPYFVEVAMSPFLPDIETWFHTYRFCCCCIVVLRPR